MHDDFSFERSCIRLLVSFNPSLAAKGDAFRRDDSFDLALPQSTADASDGMSREQLKNTNVLPRAGQPTVTVFQMLAQIAEFCGQFPISIDGRVVQTGWLAFQGLQEMKRIQHVSVGFVRSIVASNHSPIDHHFDVIDVRLDLGFPKCVATRNTVAASVEGNCLILVDFAFVADGRIERHRRKRQGVSAVVTETLGNRFLPARHDALPVVHAARQEMPIQFVEIRHSGNRRGPIALQVLHPVLDMRLFVAASREAEQGLEVVMTRKRQILVIDDSLASIQDGLGHRFGVVPPKLLGNTTEEIESLDGAVKNRFDPLVRQGDRKRAVGVCPSHDQNGNLTPAVREVDVDLAEVGFGALAGIVRKRNEGLALPTPLALDVTTNLVVTAAISIVHETPMNRDRGMPLLSRSRFVLLENRIDLVLEGQRQFRLVGLRSLVRSRFGILQDFANLLARMPELTSDLADAHPVTSCPANPCVFFHP